MRFLLSFGEVTAELGKTAPATRMWLSRHGLRAARRLAVGQRSTRALYDGEEVTRHARGGVVDCPACARVTLIASGTPVSAPSQPHGS